MKGADGSVTLVDYQKARVSSNLSAGGGASVNAGVQVHDKEVTLPTVRSIAHAAAVCDLAFTPPGEPRRPPRDPSAKPAERRGPPESAPARAGLYALDLTSAYRYICLQLLALWYHCFIWLDADGRIGICVDTRLCFGGSYGPNRFERITTLISAYILTQQAKYDRAHPLPPAAQGWVSHRVALQAAGLLQAGEHQRAPRSLQVYLDDLTGTGGIDLSPAPPSYAPLAFDPIAMRALGLEPAPDGCRLIAYATIAAGELASLDLDVATAKTMVGTSIISLGLQPDVNRDSVFCPDSKRRLLLEQIADFERALLAQDQLERKPVERFTGRACNLSQLFPEIGAQINHGYAVANTRERGGVRRRLLSIVKLPLNSKRRAGLRRLFRVTHDALGDNYGVPLAPAAAFPDPGSAGVLTVTSDASGDVGGGDAGAGGFAFHPAQPLAVFVTSELWPADIAAALAESAREPHERSGQPRLSMPAAELFAIWACAEAALLAGSLRATTSAVISVGDCLPASGALNRASSPQPQLRLLLHHTRLQQKQWLGVQVKRELNLDADILSHPSRIAEVLSPLAHAGLTPIRAPIPTYCWAALREAVAAASPDDDGTTY